MKNILYTIILIFINISNSYSEIICEPTVAQSCNKKGCEKITDPDSSTIIKSLASSDIYLRCNKNLKDCLEAKIIQKDTSGIWNIFYSTSGSFIKIAGLDNYVEEYIEIVTSLTATTTYWGICKKSNKY